MDICTALNFERYLYYLADEDTEKLSAWMRVLESTGEISVGYQHLHKAQADFTSHTGSREAILSTVTETWKTESYLLCPHSAIAVHAAKILHLNASNTICLATAHPGKFYNILSMAIPTSELPTPPTEIENVQQSNAAKYIISDNLSSLKSFIHKHIGVTKEDQDLFYVTVLAAALILIGLFTLGHRKL